MYYSEGNNASRHTNKKLDTISGYYPLAIVGYDIKNHDFYFSNIYINDYYAANPRSFEIEVECACRDKDKYVDPTPNDGILNNYCYLEIECYVMYIRYEYLQDPHPGYPGP